MSVCKICSQDLIIELDPEDFDEATSSAAGGSASSVPDDLLLTCGCHFHWQCLLDESSAIAGSLNCPSCQRPISTASQEAHGSGNRKILTQYRNEGGLQNDLDIMPLVTEEAYLEANPTARPARAYLTMCSEGDVGGIVELLNAIEEDSDEGDMSPTELLRYQDPLDQGKTGLHIAIEKSQEEVAWTLLWLASGISTEGFPSEVSHAAQVMGAGRGTATAGPDIRGLRNEQGSTAGQWAAALRVGVSDQLEAALRG